MVFVSSNILLADEHAFAAYKQGAYETVEGNVTDFRAMPYEGHQDECFSVQERQFCYSDYGIAPGFHNAALHGGPIRAGLPVRIAYREGRILKLEVPSEDALSVAQSSEISSRGERQWHERAEHDPFEQEMDTAASFTAVCWTLWWNLQWKRVMRFWLKPPYRPWVQFVFRVFFALNLVGALVALVRQLSSHSLSKENLLPTAQIASVMCAAVAVVSSFALWMAKRRDRKEARLAPPSLR